eukprot:491922_1
MQINSNINLDIKYLKLNTNANAICVRNDNQAIAQIKDNKFNSFIINTITNNIKIVSHVNEWKYLCSRCIASVICQKKLLTSKIPYVIFNGLHFTFNEKWYLLEEVKIFLQQLPKDMSISECFEKLDTACKQDKDGLITMLPKSNILNVYLNVLTSKSSNAYEKMDLYSDYHCTLCMAVSAVYLLENNMNIFKVFKLHSTFIINYLSHGLNVAKYDCDIAKYCIIITLEGLDKTMVKTIEFCRNIINICNMDINDDIKMKTLCELRNEFISSKSHPIYHFPRLAGIFKIYLQYYCNQRMRITIYNAMIILNKKAKKYFCDNNLKGAVYFCQKAFELGRYSLCEMSNDFAYIEFLRGMILYNKWKLEICHITDENNLLLAIHFLKRSYYHYRILAKRSRSNYHNVQYKQQKKIIKRIILKLADLGEDTEHMNDIKTCDNIFCRKSFTVIKRSKILCSGCKLTYYCCRSCQKRDWRDKHRFVCC